MAKMLSKSDFTKFLQCGKYLWLEKFRPDLKPETSEQQESVFKMGYVVEDFAEMLFKGGVTVEYDKPFVMEEKTREMVEKGEKLIFQASAIAEAPGAAKVAKAKSGAVKDLLLVRADIIRYNSKAKAWDLYEVKATNSVKNHHYPDVAFQKITFERAGYKINKTYLAHLNKEFVKKGPIDPEKLIQIEDISDLVKEMEPEVLAAIPLAIKVLKEKDEVQVRIVNQCYKNPYDCPFTEYCWKNVPEYSIYELSGANAEKLVALLDMGIVKIKDVPEGMFDKKKSLYQIKAVKTSKPVIEKEELREALKGLKYPLYFLDYETIGMAIPVWEGTSPHKQVPFQYSLHVARNPEDIMKSEYGEGAMEHYEFLPEGAENPVPALLKQLKRDIGPKGGTVVVWTTYEKNCHNNMAAMMPEYKKFLDSLNDRMYDLAVPFRSKNYVDADFGGSASLKYVLPVLGGGVSYEDLEIQEGSDAGRKWYLSVSGGMSVAATKKMRRDLLKYCCRDTYAEVRILRTVQGIVG